MSQPRARPSRVPLHLYMRLVPASEGMSRLAGMDVEGGGGGGHKIGVSSEGGSGENTLTKRSIGPALGSV